MRFYPKLAGLGLAAVLIATTVVACGQHLGETPTVEPGPPATDYMTVEEHFQKGNEYIQTGQFDKAAAEFEAVLKVEPERVSALTNLGVAYYNLGRLDDAIAQYQKALELGSDDADIRSNLAAAYVQKNDLAQALVEYQKSIAINPKLAQAHFGLAVVYLQQGQNDQALAELQKFQANDDGTDKLASAQANVYLAAIYMDQGDTEKALVAYQKALQVDPQLAAAHFGVGLIYAQTGQKEQAIKALEQFQQYDDGTNTAMTEQAAQMLNQLKGP
jgi:tetratricopeptide (TPR) repeat protein